MVDNIHEAIRVNGFANDWHELGASFRCGGFGQVHYWKLCPIHYHRMLISHIGYLREQEILTLLLGYGCGDVTCKGRACHTLWCGALKAGAKLPCRRVHIYPVHSAARQVFNSQKGNTGTSTGSMLTDLRLCCHIEYQSLPYQILRLHKFSIRITCSEQ